MSVPQAHEVSGERIEGDAFVSRIAEEFRVQIDGVLGEDERPRPILDRQSMDVPNRDGGPLHRRPDLGEPCDAARDGGPTLPSPRHESRVTRGDDTMPLSE